MSWIASQPSVKGYSLATIMSKTQLEIDAMQALLNAWRHHTGELDKEAKIRLIQWMLGIALTGKEEQSESLFYKQQGVNP